MTHYPSVPTRCCIFRRHRCVCCLSVCCLMEHSGDLQIPFYLGGKRCPNNPNLECCRHLDRLFSNLIEIRNQMFLETNGINLSNSLFPHNITLRSQSRDYTVLLYLDFLVLSRICSVRINRTFFSFTIYYLRSFGQMT